MLVVGGACCCTGAPAPPRGAPSATPTPESTGAEGQHRAGLPRGRQGALPHRRCQRGNRGMRDGCCQGWGCRTGAGAGSPGSPRVPPSSSRRGASELSVLPFRTSKAPRGPVSAARSLRTGTSREGGHPPVLFGTGKGFPDLSTLPSSVGRCRVGTGLWSAVRDPRVGGIRIALPVCNVWELWGN